MSTPAKGPADYLALGDYNAICYDCGRKYKASELIRSWEGFYVCERCWHPRQPQDFVRGVPDKQTPPWTQPRPADVFTGPGLFIATEDDVPITTETAAQPITTEGTS